MTRPAVVLPEGYDEDAPLLIEDPTATKPPEWNDAEDGDWGPAMVANPATAASSLGLGHGWEGSYECVGNPTRARINIVETEPGRVPNTIQIVANMSFDTVTQTGGFAVRLASEGKPFNIKVKGGGTTVGSNDDTSANDGYTAEVVRAKQEHESQVILRPREKQEVARGPHGTRKRGLFNVNATDSRIVALLSSVERVFNQTKQVQQMRFSPSYTLVVVRNSANVYLRKCGAHQVAIRLTNASVQPVVLFRVVLDVSVPGDILRVEAVVERDWGGVKRAKPVVLAPSSAETDFALVTSLVSKSLIKGDRAIDLVELAEQLKLAPETVETLQKALMKESEHRDEAPDEGSSDTSVEEPIDEHVRQEDRRAELLRQRIEQSEDGDSSESATRQDDGDDASEAGLLALGGWVVRMMRKTFRQAVTYDVFTALWRTVEQGYRNVIGIPVGVDTPVQAGFLLVAAVPLVVAFVSLLGLLELHAVIRRRAGAN